MCNNKKAIKADLKRSSIKYHQCHTAVPVRKTQAVRKQQQQKKKALNHSWDNNRHVFLTFNTSSKDSEEASFLSIIARQKESSTGSGSGWKVNSEWLLMLWLLQRGLPPSLTASLPVCLLHVARKGGEAKIMRAYSNAEDTQPTQSYGGNDGPIGANIVPV